METKREFLKKLSLLTAGGVMAGSASSVMAANSMSNLSAPKNGVGLQIYSLGGELTDDVPAGMKKLKILVILT